MFEEFKRERLINRVVSCQLHGDLQHGLSGQCHPAGAVGLIHMTAGRQRGAPIEHPDIVQPEKTALEDISSAEILAIAPPGEVGNQLLENMSKESCITDATIARPVDLIDEEGRKRMHRWINGAEVPFIGGKLAVWMDVVSLQHEFELLLGEVRIDQNQRDAMKSQVPAGVPGILPLVRHRDDVVIDHMNPVGVTDGDDASGQWTGMVLRQPPRDIEVIGCLLHSMPASAWRKMLRPS